jgi:hypothetical protein
MVDIWLPASTHRRLLEALPNWSPAHKALNDAGEAAYAVGVRRVRCDAFDAMALLQFAESCCPESAQLIRIAIRKAGTARSTRSFEPPPPPNPSRRPRHRRSAVASLDRLVTIYLLCSVSTSPIGLIAVAIFFVDFSRPRAFLILRTESRTSRFSALPRALMRSLAGAGRTHPAVRLTLLGGFQARLGTSRLFDCVPGRPRRCSPTLRYAHDT